jgi:spermidine/putrescine transport system ATP-binding protein
VQGKSRRGVCAGRQRRDAVSNRARATRAAAQLRRNPARVTAGFGTVSWHRRSQLLRADGASVTSAALSAADPNVPVISLENVHKRFGSFVAVHSADLQIRRGEFFSMLGPSGCGKTTLLRLIAGFEDVTSGCVRLDGVDVSKVPPYRRHVNTVFQQYALFPHLNVYDNVAFGPRTAGVAESETRKRVTEMLDVVRLGEFATRRPDQLSGGQRQRVALARALVNFPSALLLDEPLSALDLKLRQAMQLELKRIQREVGIAFVFVTHDQEEALTMSDRTAVMSEGRIEQVGTPEEIYLSPATVFVAGFIGAANLIPVRVVRGGDRAEVELSGGRHAYVPTGSARFDAGSEGIVMVRPERVKVSAAPPAAELHHCVVPVTVRDVIFQGPILRCLLRDDEGDDIMATIDEAERPAGLEPGARMWAVWDPSVARLLRPGPAST